MSQESGNIVRHPGRLSEEERERHLKQKGCVVWFTGLSGAGKSTLARETELALIREGRPTAVLDGDNVRHGLNKDARLLMESPGYPEETARRFGLGFSAEDRTENIRRVGEVARLFADNNMIVLAAFISPFRRDRALVRALLPEGRFIEVHCAAPLSVCEGRDVKGLYKKARAGAIRDFTGITSPYEPPENPDLVAGAGKESPEQGVLKVMQLLRERGDRTMTVIDQTLLNELAKIAEPGALLAELHRRFGSRMAIACSGQPTETAMIAMAAAAGAKPRVYTLDTLRLFPETYAHFKEVEAKYGVAIERLKPDAAETEKMVTENGENLFFDSKEKQEFCCAVRKVHPNEKMLDGLDVWVTGLRADQSRERAGIPRLEIIQHKGRPLLKAQPLVDWTEEKLRAFMKEKGIPVHALMANPLPGGWYYESLGCVICTTPIGPHEARRAGRWRWFNQDANKECGLHLPKAGKE